MNHFWNITLFNGFTVHLNTLIMTWAAMGLLLALAWLATRELRVSPSLRQTVGEGFYDFCRSITMATAGPRGDGYLFLSARCFCSSSPRTSWANCPCAWRIRCRPMAA